MLAAGVQRCDLVFLYITKLLSQDKFLQQLYLYKFNIYIIKMP